MIEIKPVTLNMLDDWYAALSAVAVEGPYLSFNAPPPKDGSKSYLENMIAENAPFYTAWADTKLVGWCDISLNKTAHNKVFARHIGDFGMAVLHQWRGQGIGQQLLIKTLAHAAHIGLEKIHLSVYSHNLAAKTLYLKNGFAIVGIQKRAFKAGNSYSDIVLMECFL